MHTYKLTTSLLSRSAGQTVTTPCYNLRWCPRYCPTLEAVKQNPVCCLHEGVLNKPGVKDWCSGEESGYDHLLG